MNDENKKEMWENAPFDQADTERKESEENLSEGVEAQENRSDEENRYREEAVSENGKAANAEEKETDSQEDAAYQEGQDAAQESDQDTVGGASYSYYTPPQYSTAYSSSYEKKGEGRKGAESAFGSTQPHKKDKKAASLRKSTVAMLLALAILLGAAAGFAGSILATRDLRAAMGDGSYNIFGSAVNVTKNDGSIKVNEVIGSTGYSNLSVAQVVELVADTVVEVFTKTQGYGQYVSSGAGSGVIYAYQPGSYGYVVTNYHVVGGSDAISLRLTNGHEYKAEYVDGDERQDIAVIRFLPNEELNVVVFGSSSAESLHVGQEVVAIGNPLGQLGGTVTDGIISALNRTITIGGVSMELLQTNAAVNPGNSGGGLFNMAGELIGIVNAKESSEGIEGLGFAIPIDNVYDMLVDILKEGYIQGRVTFGISVSYLDQLSAMSSFRLPYAGVYITSSTSSSFKRGDLIEKIGDTGITGENDYYAALGSVKVGDSVSFTVVRDGRRITVTATAQEYVPGMFS